MFSEIIFSSVLFTMALSVEQPATSYSKFNENHNTIQHIQSQPIQQKLVYQPTVYKAAPIQQAAPSYQSIGGYSSGSLQGYQGLGAYTAGSLQAVVPSYQGLGSLQSSRVPASSLSGLSFGQNLAPASYAVPVKIASPVYTKAEEYKEEDYGPAQYEFAYGVEDHHTGDIHSQKESRNGDFTQGEYSLREADGTIRTVKYTVDKHSGFNAVVERTGQPQIKAAPQYAHY